MTDMQARGQAKEISIEAVVLRCACDNPDAHAGQPCPTPKIENLGTIAFYHRNPLKRLLWRMRKAG